MKFIGYNIASSSIKDIGSSTYNVNFYRHKNVHLFRAGLEGIAYSFVYGKQILMSPGLQKGIIKAGGENLFHSSLFAQSIATLLYKEIRIFDATGAIGAIDAGAFGTLNDILTEKNIITTYIPDFKNMDQYRESYGKWKTKLEEVLINS